MAGLGARQHIAITSQSQIAFIAHSHFLLAIMSRAQPNRKTKIKLLEDDIGNTGHWGRRPKQSARQPTAPTRQPPPKRGVAKAKEQEVSEARQSTSADATTRSPSEQDPVVDASVVLPVLATAWKVNPKMLKKRAHFAFDAVAPYVEYKRGEKFAIDKDFPERGDVTPSELTDYQGTPGFREWMAYAPRSYRCDFPQPIRCFVP